MRPLLTILSVIVAAAAGSCGRPGPAIVQRPVPSPSQGTESAADVPPGGFSLDPDLDGLKMRLRSVPGQAAPAVRTGPAETTALDDATTRRLLSRLPKRTANDGAKTKAFHARPGSKPPPRTGQTVAVALGPPPAAPPAASAEPLRVLRHAPEGPVPIAPHASLTFSAPMVAIASHGQLAAQAPPARIEPQPPGRFRWLGNRTLLFDPEPRFPMSTHYRVEVPAGTASADGRALAKAHSFEFETSRLRLLDHLPRAHDTTDLSPVVVMSFDQRIDAEALLPSLRLQTRRTRVQVRRATPAEIEASEQATAFLRDAPADRTIAVVPSAPLPGGAKVTAFVEKGAASAEGPLRTRKDITFTFSTRAPLALERAGCQWRKPSCTLGQPLQLHFNNALDERRSALREGLVTVTPSIGTLEVWAGGKTLFVRGDDMSLGTHEVTVGAALTDVFGQTLGASLHTKVEVLQPETSPPYPQLQGPPEPVVTLPPGTTSIRVLSAAHRKLALTVHRVDEGDFVTYQRLRPQRHGKQPRPALPGKRVYRGEITVEDPKGRSTVDVDLAPYLKDGRGHLLVKLGAKTRFNGRDVESELIHWVQATDLGLVALSDEARLLAWVTRLSSAEPVRGAQIGLPPDGAVARTDERGLVTLPLPDAERAVLVARAGGDFALLPRHAHGWGGGWKRGQPRTTARAFTFNDRGLYKPGETAHIKGFVRSVDHGVGGDVGAAPRKLGPMQWSLVGPRGNDLGKGSAQLDDHGGFAIDVALPADMNLGQAAVRLTAGALHHIQPLSVQEFRRPRFEVSADARREEVVLGDEAIVELRANYYAGGGLPDAQVGYVATATRGRFRPAGYERFSFGPWQPWWWSVHRLPRARPQSESFTARTDSLGEHRLGLHFEAVNPPQLMRVEVRASVTDVDRQQMDTTANLVVHPSRTYVGLATDGGFTKLGEPLRVQTVVVDPDGSALPRVPAQVVLSRVTHRRIDGEWKEQLQPVTTCDVVSAAQPQPCEFEPAVGGAYVLDATVQDGAGRPNATQLRIWVSGPDPDAAQRPSAVELGEVALIPQRKLHRPGDTARVLVNAPFYPAQGVMTVERSGLVAHRAITLSEATVLEVPVESAHVPGFTLGVELVGTVARKGAPAHVTHAAGSIAIEVPPLERTLGVEVTPARDELKPGEQAAVVVSVGDDRGAPLKDASIVVMVVDEAVLTLANYTRPDPLAAFYATRPAGVERRRQRSGVQHAPPGNSGSALGDVLAEMEAAPAAAMMGQSAVIKTAGGRMLSARSRAAGGAAQAAPVRLRSDFSAAALFRPDVRTDAQGRARVELKLPDSLTRYRITAVAVDRDRRFGVGEASMRATLPLRVMPSAPRFANFGDRFELPVVLHNATDQAAQVQLAVRADNASVGPRLSALKPGLQDGKHGSLGLGVTVPARDRIEVRIPTATRLAGDLRLQVVAASAAGDSDAADIQLPVYTPATSEAFATHGELTDDVHRLQVAPPQDVFPQYGGLSVTTSSTQLQALTDALLYVVHYPYACSEQLASRILSVLSLRDVLRAFDTAGLPSDADLDAMIDSDIEELGGRQVGNGGFGFWSRQARRDNPYVTVHVGAALALAKDRGRRVPARMLKLTRHYLAHIERHIPKHYSERSRLSLRSYALEVRRRLGDPDAAAAERLWRAHHDALSVESMGWLLPSLAKGGKGASVAAILRALDNRATQTASKAHFTTAYEDGEYTILHSRRRADAVVLDALLQVRPGDALISKLVRGLLGHRVRGRWLSTQENTFVLQALHRYFQKREGVTPDFVARVWLGNARGAEHAFRGRTTERARLDVPMDALRAQGKELPLTLARAGKGRLYYRVGLRYAPRDLALAASDHGFALRRSYRAVDDPQDVQQLKDGSYRIRAGARVEVEVEMAAESVRHHVALVDPLPAGLEALNPALRAETVPPDAVPLRDGRSAERYWWWSRAWYEHQNMRDERVEAFSSRLHAGVHTYRYFARATTPGDFVVPPAKAEEMYDPETFGRSDSARVTIE